MVQGLNLQNLFAVHSGGQRPISYNRVNGQIGGKVPIKENADIKKI